MPLDVEILDDAAAVAARGAALIAGAARDAIAARGHFAFAVSGGRAPWAMLRALADLDVAWERTELFQVDERVAPLGDPDRNWTHICETLVDHVALGARAHPMPVEDADLEVAAQRYAQALTAVCGAPPVLDLIHLGLGPDGHTASLVPGDPVLDVTGADVATTRPYQDRRRMTLTYPAITRARQVLWVITGADKRDALARLRRSDPSIPAGRVRTAQQVVLAGRESVGDAAAR